MVLFLPCLLNSFRFPYLRSHAIVTTHLLGVSEITEGMVQFCPQRRVMGELWVPGSSSLSKVASPSLGTGATPLNVIGERPPWLKTMGWEGSHSLAVLSVSELEDTDSWGNEWLVLALSQLCVRLLLCLRQWAWLEMKF